MRDPRYPVHKIADQLEPYLRVLLENFQPQKVILFGSYAYGKPTEHSDVDLLIIKPRKQSPVREAISIRRAWRPVRAAVGPLPFDLIVTSPEDHQRRLSHAAGFYSGIEILQEAVERFLKGFLIAKGGQLRKVHDLTLLNDEAKKFEPKFDAFDDLCESLTEL